MNFWEADPIAPTIDNAVTSGDWWKNDPVAPPEYPDYSGEGQIPDVIAKYTPPEWATRAAKGVSKFASENVPHAFSEVPAFASPLNIRGMYDEGKQNYQIIKDVASGMSVDEATRKNAPERLELKDALQMPLGSQEQYDVGAKLLGSAAMIGLPFLHRGASRGVRDSSHISDAPSDNPAMRTQPIDAVKNEAQQAPRNLRTIEDIPAKSLPQDIPAKTTSAEQYPSGYEAPPQHEATAPKEGPQAQSTASVPAMITKQMESDLRGLGVSDEQIYRMTPAEAHEILQSRADPGISEVLSSFEKKYKPSYIGEDYANISPETGSGLSGKEKRSGPVLGESPQSAPSDAGKEVGQPTSTQNAVTAAEREASGLPEAEQAARRDFGTVWDDAAKVAQDDPEAPRRLVESIRDNPRALSDQENALLLRRQIEVQNAHETAIKAVNDAPGDVEAQSRLEGARNDLQAVYDAGKAAGTETGRGLSARRMLANNDFSLAKMEAEYRAVANSGKPLSPKQAAEVKGLHERIKQMESKLSAYEANDAVREGLKKARAERKPFSPVRFLSEQEVKARERISGRLTKLYADPLGVTNVAHLADEAIIGAAHIARGIKKFGDWSAAMIKEFGDGIKPYLRALFARSQSMHYDAARLAATKARTVTQTVQTLRRIGSSDFEPRKPVPIKPDKELMLLRGNLQRAKDIWSRKLAEHKLRNQTPFQKLGRYTSEVANTSRALKTSFDVSAVLRQGGILSSSHPVLAAKNLEPMFRALASEKAQYAVMEEIKSRPNFERYKQSGLELTEVGGPLSHQEEVFRSRLADKIPGVGASERAYTTFLNRMRADSFDAMDSSLSKTGKATPAEAKIIANYINVASGRGPLGRFQGAANALNTGFFAPRWAISRFQYLLGQPMFRDLGKGSFRVRTLIAKEYARSLSGIGVVLGLGTLAGATISTDSNNPDFGKLKFGNTRLDMFSGLTQAAVFMSREANATRRAFSKNPEKVPNYLKGGEVAMRFLRGKLAPIPGAVIDVQQGENVVGQKVTPTSAAWGLITPLAYSDIKNALEDQGVEKGTVFGLLSLFGAGLQTYQAKPSRNTFQFHSPSDLIRKSQSQRVQEFVTHR